MCRFNPPMRYGALWLTLVALWASSGPVSAASREQFLQDSAIYAPTPDDWATLHLRACDAASHTALKTRHQLLADHYANDTHLGSHRMRAHLQKYEPRWECRQEPADWRFKYIEEDGGVAVRERSAEERLANVVYTARANKGFAFDSYLYDSGDPEEDERNKRLVAGSQVNDELCAEQLSKMLALIDDLGARLEAGRRAASNEPLTDQHLSLVKVLDSFGRYDSGFLTGRLLSAGLANQCEASRLLLNVTLSTPMRFCWAHLSLRAHLSKSLLDRKRSAFETPVEIISTGICLPRACHSKSHPQMAPLIERLVATQFGLPEAMYATRQLPLHSVFCPADADAKFGLPLEGKILLAALLGWTFLSLAVTYKNSSGKRHQRSSSLLDQLDLGASWRDFLQARNSRDHSARAQLVDLNTMNALKAIGCLFVVMAHSLLLNWGYAQSELLSTRFIETHPLILAMGSGTTVVETFVVISGLLLSYFALKQLHKCDQPAPRPPPPSPPTPPTPSKLGDEQHQGFIEMSIETSKSGGELENGVSVAARSRHYGRAPRTAGSKFLLAFWLKLTTLRYIRIVPMFALIHWFKKYVYIYAGSGPLWDHGFNWRSAAGACRREPAWIPLTFGSAYLPTSHQCLSQSWSISNDLFFALLAPPILWLLHRRPRLAALVSLLIGSASYLAAKLALARAPAHLDEPMREMRGFGVTRIFDELSLLYTAPHHRIFCFLVGLWAGYYLHRRQLEAPLPESPSEGAQAGATPNGRHKSADAGASIEWPQWMRGIGTKLAIVQVLSLPLLSSLRGPIIEITRPLHRLVWHELYTSTRLLWSVSNAILLLRLVTDWRYSALGRFSASKFFQVFSKLNYAILLLHVDLIILTIQVSPAPPTNFTIWGFFILGAAIMFICVPLSVFVFLVYENTIDNLTRALLVSS